MNIRKIATAAAAAGLVLGGVAVGMPPAAASTMFQVRNEGPGGCLKDQGLGNAYTVSKCDISSNFTIWNSYSHNGAPYEILIDGSGFCPTLSGSVYKAGICVAAASTQELLDESVPPAGVEWTWYDFVNVTGNEMVKGGVSPYYANSNSNPNQQPWFWL